jgi:hypothetical protein
VPPLGRELRGGLLRSAATPLLPASRQRSPQALQRYLDLATLPCGVTTEAEVVRLGLLR